ncbi:MAG: molybdopterin-dependent oxidoreductase [Candidatus Aramenus sulfurataquae]|jgi:anaerobic selenocysteine-containing dehydrogenase|uniref:Molybdopterin-dependent oxidoreductase n=3 Tax=Candidatus Aramenus sulfurataquae TaxID=1326980 RepID=A0AAE3FLE1_9CREN|nr:molybdopterin-dependent oxidoreductase [Candidatus Aramenus sulfurataquae]
MVFQRCYMCKNACGIIVTVEGKSVRVSANRNHPQPGICGRGAAGPYLLTHPDRLKGPLIRQGDSLVQTTWDKAMDEVVKRLKELRDEGHPEYLAITFHDYGKELLERFARLYGTPNLIGHESVCHGPRTVAAQLVLGAEGPRSVDPDYPNSKFVVFIGRNPLEGIVPDIVRRIDEGRKRGMKIAVLDPRRSAIAERYADRWIPIRPGTDSAFVLSLIYFMIREKMYDEDFLKRYSNATLLVYEDDLTSTGKYADELLYEGVENGRKVATAFYLLMKEGERVYGRLKDITGATYDDVKYLAENLWDNRPAAAIDDGWHTSFSTDSTYTWMAVFIVNAMLGNLDKKGGLVFSKKEKVKLYSDEVKTQRIDKIRYPLAYAAFQEVYKAILTGSPYPIKALMVVGTNLDGRDPNSELVRRALSKVDFLVVVDVMPSDVTQYAHVVLAESTYLERDELPLPVGWTLEGWVDVHQKAVEPLYDTKPLWWIILELEHKLGLSNATFSELEKAILDQLKVNREELYAKGAVKIEGELYDVYPYKRPLNTPSGKVEIYSETLRKFGYYPIPTYLEKNVAPRAIDEFYLTTGHTLYHTQDSVTFDIPALIKLAPDNPITMNKRRAEVLGIKDNDEVELVSLTTGQRVRARVKLTDGIREDTVFTYFGFGRHSKGEKFAYGHGFDVNSLISDQFVDPVSGSVAQSLNIVKVVPLKK